MKKKIFLFICLFFTLQMSVFATKCPSGKHGDDGKGKTVLGLYENVASKKDNLGIGCGGNVNSSDYKFPGNVNVDPQDGTEAKIDDYKCYKKRKVLIMLDDSNSMGKGKLDKSEALIEKIAEVLNSDLGVDSLMKVCYFSGKCLAKNEWRKPKKFEDIDLKRNNKNTNFIAAYNKIDEELKEYLDYIPIVFFVTDGYPTEFTKRDGGVKKLGYLSSAKYGFKAANRLENLIKEMNSGSFTQNVDSNPYAKTNPRIITVGVGIDTSDTFAKFVLNPTKKNKDLLEKKGESETLKNILENKSTPQYQLVAGACSFPDKSGLVKGKYINKNGKNIAKFEESELRRAMSNATGKNICFTVGSNSASTLQYCSSKKKNGTCKKYTDVPFKGIEAIHVGNSDGSGPNDGQIVELKKSFFDSHKVNYRMVSTTSFPTYNFNDVNFNYAQVYGQYFGSDAIKNVKKDLGTNSDDDPLKFDNGISSFVSHKDKITVTHTNAIKQTVTINNPTTYNGTIYSTINVEVLLTEGTNFNAGTLGSIEKVPSGGRGFSFQDVSITNTIKWYYRKFATTNNEGKPANPIIKLCRPSRDCVEVKQNADVTINNLDSLIWKKLNAAPYINDISSTIKTAFKTIDSNNKDNNNSILPIDVTMNKNCTNVVNADSNINSLCTITYNVSQKVGCVNKKTKEFKYDDNCNNASGDYSKNPSNPYQYYIPYDLGKRDDVSININSAFSSIGLRTKGNNRCSFAVGGSNDGNPPTQFSNLIYRSIDVGEPFPAYNVNKQLDTIPINWRSWYDNVTNRSRLKNSYEAGKLNYTIVLDNAKISEINKNTNLNPNVYSRLEEMNNNGTNSFVIMYASKKTTTNINYCPVSEFDETCDK